jgi:hypothetical protein
MHTATAHLVTGRSGHWTDAVFWELVLADPDLLDTEFAATVDAGGLLDRPRPPACRLMPGGRPGNRARHTPPREGPVRQIGSGGTAALGHGMQRGPPKASLRAKDHPVGSVTNAR